MKQEVPFDVKFLENLPKKIDHIMIESVDDLDDIPALFWIVEGSGKTAKWVCDGYAPYGYLTKFSNKEALDMMKRVVGNMNDEGEEVDFRFGYETKHGDLILDYDLSEVEAAMRGKSLHGSKIRAPAKKQCGTKKMIGNYQYLKNSAKRMF